MKKLTKIAVISSLSCAAFAPSLSMAHDIWLCGGKQNLAFGSKYGNANTPHNHWTTRVQGTNQASQPWQDWIWRGKSEGKVQFCQQGSRSCVFTWGGSKTQGYARSTGTSVGFDLAFSAEEAGKRWLNDETRSQSTTQTWAAGATFSPGQWAEPVIAVSRRWKQGYFAGFFEPKQQVSWDECNRNLAWAYNWNGERRDGHWTKNEAEYTFKMFFVTTDRNKL